MCSVDDKNKKLIDQVVREIKLTLDGIKYAAKSEKDTVYVLALRVRPQESGAIAIDMSKEHTRIASCHDVGFNVGVWNHGERATHFGRG